VEIAEVPNARPEPASAGNDSLARDRQVVDMVDATISPLSILLDFELRWGSPAPEASTLNGAGPHYGLAWSPPKKNAGSTRGPTLQMPCLMPFLSAPLERIDKFRCFPPLDSPQKEQETARYNRRATTKISTRRPKKV